MREQQRVALHLRRLLAMLVVNCIHAYSLLKAFNHVVNLHTQSHRSTIPADFAFHLRQEWLLDRDGVTQAATIYPSGQLVGVLLVGLLSIVLVTSEVPPADSDATGIRTLWLGAHLGRPGRWTVDRSILPKLTSYLLWAVFGIGFDALVPSQVTATVSATVLSSSEPPRPSRSSSC